MCWCVSVSVKGVRGEGVRREGVRGEGHVPVKLSPVVLYTIPPQDRNPDHAVKSC